MSVAVAAPADGSLPPQHSSAFRLRRFANWFPLGITYAAFYMGRYNFYAFKPIFSKLFGLDKVQVGVVLTAGFWTYALSVLANGPLADRFGGKKAILLGGLGAAAANLTIGLLFFGGWHTHLVLGMSLLYACNCYFQSFGALSVVKVNAHWFHVRERGFFGGLFGIMISSGYTLALVVGGYILKVLPFWAVFVIPAGVLVAMAAVDFFLVENTPAGAGFPDFDTGDASGASTGADAPFELAYVVRQVLRNPTMVTLAFAEFCTGFVRQGLVAYYAEFLTEHHGLRVGDTWFALAGLGITVGGVIGGLLCGWMSDRLFQSRRAPVAFIFYCLQIPSVLLLGFIPSAHAAAILVGFCCIWIFGVHGMLSGTASADFGGRKAAATATGLLDGVQYVAAGFTGFGLGWILKHHGWGVWTACLVPFSAIGALLMLRLWNARPRGAATH